MGETEREVPSPVQVDRLRLRLAAGLLREACKKGRERQFLATVGKLRRLGWLGEPEAQDAMLRAPEAWMVKVGLIGGQGDPVPGEDEVARAVVEALRALGPGAEVIQVRRVKIEGSHR